MIMHRFTRGLLTGFLAGPLIAALIAISGFWPVTALPDPPRLETVMARRALSASSARQAPRLQNPLSPSGDVLQAGLKGYRDGCAGCHGDYQKPSHWGMTAFYPRAPQFASEPPDKPEWQLFWIVKNGIRYTGMGAWSGEMPDDKIWQVVTFLSRMGNLPPELQAEWTHQPAHSQSSEKP